jgi:hypothetical protein
MTHRTRDRSDTLKGHRKQRAKNRLRDGCAYSTSGVGDDLAKKNKSDEWSRFAMIPAELCVGIQRLSGSHVRDERFGFTPG